MKNAIVIGAGGHAKVVIDTLTECEYQIVGVYDNVFHDSVFGFKFLGVVDEFITSPSPNYIIAIGNNKVRRQIAKELGESIIKAIHPNAYISKNAEIGHGNMVMSHVSINAGTKIGDHCIINTNASVDHDCILEDYVHISPQAGLAGNIFIGEGTHVGIGAQIIQGVKIGKWVTIGAGAVVLKDVPDHAVVVGNPGRIVKLNT